MHRFNKSSQAPVGAAFFLFLGLAILPVSLKATGVVSLTPRLSAAMDAWQQITEVFGASYQPGTTADLSVMPQSDDNPCIQTDSTIDMSPEIACDREFKELNLIEVSESKCLSTLGARRAVSKAGPRFAVPAKPVASIVVANSVMKSQAVEALGALRLEIDTRVELLKGIEKQLFRPDLTPIVRFKDLPVTKDLRVVSRAKRAAAASSEKTECKVYSALASERKRDCERAVLISLPNINPAYSEF